MRVPVGCPQRFEFSISNNGNRVLVENQTDGVVIRAARDNVSSREKLFFIRHLAAEGFIPERYRWIAGSEAEPYSGLMWMVDASRVRKDSAVHRKALRQILRLIFWASLLWLALVAFAFLYAPH